MKNLWVLVVICFVVQLCKNNVQAHPHRSIEDTDEDTSSSTSAESVGIPTAVEHVHVLTPERESSHVREMTSHESKSHEDDDSSEEERDENRSDEDDTVRFPKTESLCPARPEEISNIELECAREYQLWKELRAKKDITTTCEPVVETNQTAQSTNSSEETMNEEILMSTQEMSTHEMTTHGMSTQEVTTEEMTTKEMTTEEMMTETEPTTEMATTPTTMMTTQRPTTTTTTPQPIRRSNNNNSGRKHRRSTVKRKRSCYPATCILKKLNLLDSMGQPSIKQIQKFAVNMTIDDSMNLEEKAAECVREINVAMVDATSDIGKKVGCVAQKVITCLNKGLTCPIMKVPQ